jgi:hypothetical protein
VGVGTLVATVPRNPTCDRLLGRLDLRKKTNNFPKNLIPRISEETIETQIINTLALLGYTVWKTGRDRRGLIGKIMSAIRPHLKVGVAESVIFASVTKAVTQWAGNDLGLPDIILRHPEWGRYEMMGIEVKAKDTKISVEQSLFSSEGAYPICRSISEVAQVLLDREGNSPRMIANLKSLL